MFIVGILAVIENIELGQAYPFWCRDMTLETDKDTYYGDEYINISASWDLFYDPGCEISAVRIFIYNTSNQADWYGDPNVMQWNSPVYSDVGIFDGWWIVDVQDLYMPSGSESNVFYVAFFYYWTDLAQEYGGYYLYPQITVEKRNISCEVVEFRDRLTYGDSLDIKVAFYNTTLENKQILDNYLVIFKIISSNVIVYEKEYTTDENGMIEINILSTENFTLGFNYLVFETDGDLFFNNMNYTIPLYVGQRALVNIVEAEEEEEQEKGSDILSVILLVLVLSISALVSGFIYKNKKRIKKKPLETTFRY